MRIPIKLIDAILFFFFLVIAFSAPLIDSQTCLPSYIFPTFLINLKSYYAHHYNDYLFIEKPHFFVALIWIEILFQWPLALASLYAIVSRKSWLPTTCLIYGASTFTSVVTILYELIGSGRGSEKLLTLTFPFLGFAVLAILRGLIPHSIKGIAMDKTPAPNRNMKKRA